MECSCRLRNEHDTMADGKNAFEERCGETFDGPSMVFSCSKVLQRLRWQRQSSLDTISKLLGMA